MTDTVLFIRVPGDEAEDGKLSRGLGATVVGEVTRASIPHTRNVHASVSYSTDVAAEDESVLELTFESLTEAQAEQVVGAAARALLAKGYTVMPYGTSLVVRDDVSVRDLTFPDEHNGPALMACVAIVSRPGS